MPQHHFKAEPNAELTHWGLDVEQMEFAGFFRWALEGFVSKRTAVVSKRLEGYACYDDVFNALLYWNNKDAIIPNLMGKKCRRCECDTGVSTC